MLNIHGKQSFYRQVGVKRDSQKGRKVWNLPGTKNAKEQQSLESAATLTLGSMFLARSSINLHRKIDLTNAFKSIFRDNSFELCSKIAGFLLVLGGRMHACARARASEKLRTTKFGTCRVPYHEALVRASGKDLAQC